MKSLPFPQFINNHPLSYLNYLNPLLQEACFADVITEDQARILNFPGICQLIEKKELHFNTIKDWNYQQASALNTWTQEPNQLPLATMLAYIEEEKLYSVLCYPTIFQWYCSGLLNKGQLERLTEQHCLTIISNKTNLSFLFSNGLTSSEFLEATSDQLNQLVHLSMELCELFVSLDVPLAQILETLDLPKTEYLDFIHKQQRQVQKQTIEALLGAENSSLETYYNYINRHVCVGASDLIKKKIIPFELSKTMLDAEWLTFHAWFEFPSSYDYESILANYQIWSSTPWRRFSSSYRLLSLEQFHNEAAFDTGLDAVEFAYEYFDSLVRPLIDAKIITVEQFLGLNSNQLDDLKHVNSHVFKKVLLNEVPFFSVIGSEQDTDDDAQSDDREDLTSTELHYPNPKRQARHSMGFFSSSLLPTSSTLPDGNCAFNAVVLFLRDLYLTPNQTIQLANFTDLLCINPTLRAQGLRTESDLRHFFTHTNKVDIQRVLAPVLRTMVCDEMNNPDKIYNLQLLERLIMMLEYMQQNPDSANIPEGDTFLVHDFIFKKFTVLVKNIGLDQDSLNPEKLSQFIDDVSDWWLTEGFSQYLQAISIAADSPMDSARWGGELELDVLAKLFGFYIKLTKNNTGCSYVGASSDTICRLTLNGEHWTYEGMGEEADQVLTFGCH